eukprot:TRINITY_DN6582_c0_g1_i2.p1 TRINITY_DN6582_c0_g1~~TRINITY_DN6582_c0_g1_i2.p1  ORF type:complete len:327 (-),score=31.28 TRINITY_DN6582_c0_g1_i2:413-1393(-)
MMRFPFNLCAGRVCILYPMQLQIWRRISVEVMLEVPLLLEKWKFLLFGILCQYLHGVMARVAHYLHRPQPLLHDIGFQLLPELGVERAYLSETLFTAIFFTFLLWSFHPFVFHSKRFYTVIVWYRTLVVLVVCQLLRVITFLSTQLPGPNYHCREGSPGAMLPPPKNFGEVININFPRGVIFGCGDLIFSSHMIFALVFVRTYQKYGTKSLLKFLAWMAAIVLGILIIASRKHYSVDVVVAWYVTMLVFSFMERHLPDRERAGQGTSPLLPSTLRGKDGRTKDEFQKVANGTSDLSSEWRQRMPINGKPVEDVHSFDLDVVVNGNL